MLHGGRAGGWSDSAIDASPIPTDTNKERDREDLPRHLEHLDTLDHTASGAASETVLRFISNADLPARWTGAHDGCASFAYVRALSPDKASIETRVGSKESSSSCIIGEMLRIAVILG